MVYGRLVSRRPPPSSVVYFEWRQIERRTLFPAVSSPPPTGRFAVIMLPSPWERVCSSPTRGRSRKVPWRARTLPREESVLRCTSVVYLGRKMAAAVPFFYSYCLLQIVFSFLSFFCVSLPSYVFSLRSSTVLIK